MNYEQKYNDLINRLREYRERFGNPLYKEIGEEFPELRESEEERLRKAALEGIEHLERNLGWDAIGDIDILDVKEYLENLKEQKPDLEFIQRSWYMDGYIDGEFKREPRWNLKAGKGGPRYEENEKYGQLLEQKPVNDKAFEEWIDGWYNEHHRDGYITMDEREFKNFCRGIRNMYQQKPVEWDDYTKTNLGRAIQIIKNAKGNLQGYQTDDGIYECDKAIECLEHFLYRGLEIEKPAEWSEEDEKMRQDLIAYFVGKDVIHNPGLTFFEAAEWLKSLRSRQDMEWNKEDEMYLSQAIETLEHENYLILADKLKSLRLRPKPERSKKDKKIVRALQHALNCADAQNAIAKSGVEVSEVATFLQDLVPSWKPSEKQIEALDACNRRQMPSNKLYVSQT